LLITNMGVDILSLGSKLFIIGPSLMKESTWSLTH